MANGYTGNRIKELRMSRGLTQEKLAERMCCSRTAVTKMENGFKEPTYHEIICLCRALQCTPNDLFEREVCEELSKYYELRDQLGGLSPRKLEKLIHMILSFMKIE